jgi:dihydrofolate reductase
MTKHEFNAIVAMNSYNIIGVNNALPWIISEDLRRFKTRTLLGIVVMGRKTFQSLPNGALTHRINIVLTHKPDHYESTESLYFVDESGLMALLDSLQSQKKRDVFVIGGEEVYKLLMPYTTKIYLTLVHKYIEPSIHNAHFPIEFDNIGREFKCISTDPIQHDSIENCMFQYFVFERKPVTL